MIQDGSTFEFDVSIYLTLPHFSQNQVVNAVNIVNGTKCGYDAGHVREFINTHNAVENEYMDL